MTHFPEFTTWRSPLFAGLFGATLLIVSTGSSFGRTSRLVPPPTSPDFPDLDLPDIPPTLIFSPCDAIATVQVLGQSCVTNPYSEEDVCYTISATTADMCLDDGWCAQVNGEGYPAEPCKMRARLKLQKMDADGLDSSPIQCPPVPGNIHLPEAQRILGDNIDEFPDCAYWHFERDGRKPNWTVNPPTNVQPASGASEGDLGPPNSQVPCGEKPTYSATVKSGGSPESSMTAAIKFHCRSEACDSGD